MSPSEFYREQAAQQQTAADAATLQNVRDRCERAAKAWGALASRSERDGGRSRISGEPPAGPAGTSVDPPTDHIADQGDRP